MSHACTWLQGIGKLYHLEGQIQEKDLDPEQILAYRGEYLKPLVDEFFEEPRGSSRPRLWSAPLKLDHSSRLI